MAYSSPSGDEPPSEIETESDETDEEESPDVGIALALPSRSNRGSRYQSLLIDAKSTQVDEFWSHETWNEEECDADYNCSEGEEFYKDIVDSDFDEAETEEDEEVTEVQTEEKRKKKTFKAYVDPAKIKHAPVRNVRAKKRPLEEHEKSIYTDRDQVNQFKEEPTIKSIQSKPTTRFTTRLQSQYIQDLQQERAEKKRALIEKRKREIARKRAERGSDTSREPTQEEHLLEAQRTENENRESLVALQTWEIEKKRYNEYKKLSYKGHYDVWITYASDHPIGNEVDNLQDNYKTENQSHEDVFPKEIRVFTDGILPELYCQPSIENKQIPLCAISGLPAKYFDPLTKQYYADSNCFGELRLRFHNQQDAVFQKGMVKIQEELLKKFADVKHFLS